MASQTQVVRPPHKTYSQLSAWLTLLGFFAIFCIIVAAAGVTGWFYYRSATQELPPATVIVHAPVGVSIQQPNTSDLIIPQTPCADGKKVCAALTEGMRVVANSEAGYGSVASLVLADRSQIDLWAHPTGADLWLDTYHASRWTNNEQIVRLHQTMGYARYDIHNGQRYNSVQYTVTITDKVWVELALGGSYSINVPSTADQPSGVTQSTDMDSNTVPLVVVAVRSGVATIHSGTQQQLIEANTKRQVTAAGVISELMLPTWQLVKDGRFRQYAQQNFYVPDQSKTWERFWTFSPDLQIDERNGVFNVIRSCSPETPVLCENNQVNIGQFRRDGNQTRPFFIGLQQPLDADISEYKSLQLSAWVRVVSQSLPSVGDGTECPLLIHLDYKKTSPSDETKTQYICIYSTEDGNVFSNLEKHGDIYYKPVPRFEWYRIEKFELRDIPALKDVRYLQMIRIEARGHDYVSEISDISLVGKQ